MLSTLSIQNVVLIDRLVIPFAQGLCALTGETGAGKSILLDSLGLALGHRSDAGLVRKGAEQAIVSASFDLPDNHSVIAILEEAGVIPDSVLILRRVVNKDGRSKAFINDQPVSVGLLKQVGEQVLEIHGQFDTRALLDVSAHREMLDDYAGIDGGIAALWQSWKSKERALKQMQEDAAQARHDEAFLRQAIEDLDALDPRVGEEEELASLRDRLMSREQVLTALNNAYQALNGDEDPIRSAWGAVDRVVDKLGEQGHELVDTLSRASTEMQEAISLIQSISADLEENEHSLETIDERLFTLRSQARKHSCAVDDLPAIRDGLAQKLNMIEHGDAALADQMRAVDEARAAYVEKAKKVSEIRQKAASALDGLVAQELPPLKLERARFVTQVSVLEESQWGPHGMDDVRFLVATNPGVEPGALGKIASGGELSRFMLALKVVMAAVGGAGSLIFDEVDAGIGGSTADAVGERLSRLAASKQILVVTHSPQVAARANHHLIVQKGGAEEVTTSVQPLSTRLQRAEEIARMLAGATITPEARAAAEKLLDVA